MPAHNGYRVYENMINQIAQLQNNIPSFLTSNESWYVSKAFSSLNGLINTQIAEMDRLGYRHKIL
ncbi:hypothetical protein C815_00677 [Firmicutes bacterium M10-2]|nr:hypothetical protein C815_00677 [Firmicutes bacterium M10-2]